MSASAQEVFGHYVCSKDLFQRQGHSPKARQPHCCITYKHKGMGDSVPPFEQKWCLERGINL